MRVDFFASLRQIVGQKTVDIPVNEGATVRQLVKEIVHSYPELEPEILDQHGDLYGHVHVIINGRDSTFLDQGIDTIVTESDRVSVFPAIGGG